MHEIVHISHGPQANWLTSEFFNVQQTYFIYSKDQLPYSHVDPTVRFTSGKEYTPRAEFWDFRGGFGHLQRISEKYESKQVPDNVQKIEGHQLPPGEYWTDDLQIPLHPANQHEVLNWEFDPEKFPRGRQRGSTPESGSAEFTHFDMGVDEFKELGEDHLEDTLRTTLERCDLLSGIYLTTQCGGWSGFSSSFAESLRDEYSPRTPLFSWMSTPTFKGQSANDTFLETMLHLSEFSSLVIPLQDPASEDMKAIATTHLPLFETIGILSSLRKNRVSMHTLTEQLTACTNGTNIIRAPSFPISPFVTTKSPMVRARLNVVRAGTSGGIPVLDDPLFPPGSEDSEEQRVDYVCPQSLAGHVDKELYRLVLDNSPVSLRKLVSPRNHDMRERVYDLTEPYIWTWDSDSDE